MASPKSRKRISGEELSQIFLVMIGLIALVTLLVASLVSFLVFVLFKVPLLGVVQVFRMVISAFAHTLLVLLVFRIILACDTCGNGDAAARTVLPVIPVPSTIARIQTHCCKFIRTRIIFSPAFSC
jgi:phosphoglycerol transferase MdoB-like AlkP superfamily enzyme